MNKENQVDEKQSAGLFTAPVSVHIITPLTLTQIDQKVLTQLTENRSS